MSERERFQTMMLDHLYGLLEPSEVEQLETYLASPDGQSLRHQGETWKSQINAAAKAEFPEVQFIAPSTTAKLQVTATVPVVTPKSLTVKPSQNGAPARQARFRAGWAIAASVLITALGFGIPTLSNFLSQRDIQAKLAEKETQLQLAQNEQKKYASEVVSRHERINQEMKKASETHDELLKQFEAALNKARKAVQDKQFFVRLTGPERAQPGAPNEWEIRTVRRDGVRTTPQKIEMVVRDQQGNVLFKDEKKPETKDAFQEPPKLTLPISFWEKVKPETELFLDVAAYDETNTRSKLCEKIQLARPVYETQLVTDKPMYKPGDVLYFRSLTLDRATFLPPEQNMKLKFTLAKPNSEKIEIDSGVAQLAANPQQPDRRLLGPDKKPIRGIACGEFTFPADTQGFPGGEYTLSVTEAVQTVDEVHHRQVEKDVVLATRKVLLNEYKPEIFEKKLEFDGKSYSAGDTVMVRAEASRPEGKLKGASVNVQAVVDGQNIAIAPTKTDDQGVVRLKFQIPQHVTRGEGSVTLTFADNGVVDTIVRSIPLIGRELKIDFYPEGGDLVEGVPGRVYFQASTPAGKPADIRGVLTDGNESVADVATVTDPTLPGMNRGQGSFTFTPQAGKKYFLKLQKPSSIIAPRIHLPLAPRAVAGAIGLGNLVECGLLYSSSTTGFELPKARADGVVLTALDPVSRQDEPLRFRLATAKGSKTLLVGAYARGRLLAHQRTVVEAGKPVEVQLTPASKLGGVTRVTVFEEKTEGEGRADLTPVAERLVYRKPGEQLLLNATHKTRYFPGSPVEVEINALNEQEKNVPAIVMVAVVNQSVITMADEKTARLLPTHFLLASEVNKPDDLEHADFLLTDDPQQMKKAGEALDRLLGTQGWRRFAEQHPNLPNPKDKDAVDRLMVANGQKTQTPIETLRQEEQRVEAEFQSKIEVSSALLVEAEKATADWRNEAAAILVKNKVLEVQVKEAERARYSESLALEELKVKQQRSLNLILPIIGVALVLIAGFCGVLALRRKGREAVPYYASAGGIFGLAACSVLVVVVLNGDLDQHPFSVTAKNESSLDQLLMPTKDVADGGKIVVLDEAEDARVFRFRPGAAPGGGMGGGAMKEGKPMWGAKMDGFNAPAMAPGVAPTLPPRGFAPQPPGPDNGLQGAPAALEAMMERAEADKMHKPSKGAAGAVKSPAPVNMALNKDMKKSKTGEEFAKNRRVMAEKYRDMNDVQNRKMEKRVFQNAPRPMMPNAPVAGPHGDGEMFLREQQNMAKQLEWAAPFYVREYAHHSETGKGDTRNDFTETVYWHPALVLPDNGHASVHFDLSDDIARYQVLVAGHTLDGRIGAMTTTIEARKPFSVNPKLPFEITATDRIDMPISVMNDTDERRVIRLAVTPTGLKPVDESAFKNGGMQDFLELGALKGGRKVMAFRAEKTGEVMLRVVGTSDPMAAQDEIERRFRVVPDGFPIGGSFSDLLEGGRSAPGTLTLPKDIVPGTLKVSLNVYPTTLSDMVSGLDGLLREPGGCFEQTSTSNYPNLLILDYLKTSDQAKPEVAQRAREMLDRGYAKLVAFECNDTPQHTRQGFEWFGRQDQQHEALTAYGLLQFKDLAKVYEKVDPQMIQRTQKYLLSRRDGNGGFQRNGQALDSFGRAPAHTTNAYIVWALTASDPDDKEGMDLSKELTALKAQSRQMMDDKKADTYFLALVANSLLNRPADNNRSAAIEILKFIAKDHQKEGWVSGAETSITRSGGRDLNIETTALTVLGWIRANDKPLFSQAIAKATKWLCQQRDAGGAFGSTQSTILALKALITEANTKKTMPEAGKFTLIVGDKKFTKEFSAKDTEVITLDIPDAEKVFHSGANEVQVEISSKNQYPFALQWNCFTTLPTSAPQCAVELTTQLGQLKAVEGDSVPLTVSLRNKLDQDQGMSVAIIGIPGGMKIPTDMKQLKELTEKGKIGYFEVKGRELVIYWRAMKKQEKIDLTLDLICETPGEYRGPASRGYLYYNADHKHWLDPLKIEIAARDNE